MVNNLAKIFKSNRVTGQSLYSLFYFTVIGKISLTSPIVINVSTRASLAVNGLLFLWLAHLKNKSNVLNRYLAGYQRIFADILFH